MSGELLALKLVWIALAAVVAFAVSFYVAEWFDD